MNDLKTLSCGILAGGRSRRMGRDKAFLPFRGCPLIEHQIRKFSPRFFETIVAVRKTAPFRGLDVRIVRDRLRPCCPLSGIHAVLSASRTPWCFIVAVDHPYISLRLVHRLLRETRRPGMRIVVPRVKGAPKGKALQPLYALYHRDCLEDIAEAARCHLIKLQTLLKDMAAYEVRIAPAEWHVNGHDPFTNWNTPGDTVPFSLCRATLRR